MNLTDKQKMQQRMALPFEDKLQLTKLRIKDWYNHWDGDVFVGFSGGKDSTVLLHIVRSIYPNVEAVFSDTGLEMPEIRNFVKRFDNVTRVRPKKPFNKVIEEDGFALISKKASRQIRTLRAGPDGQELTYRLYDEGITSEGHSAPSWKLAKKWRKLVNADIKTSEKCCDHLKKEPLHSFIRATGKMPFSGMMASEGGIGEAFHSATHIMGRGRCHHQCCSGLMMTCGNISSDSMLTFAMCIMTALLIQLAKP